MKNYDVVIVGGGAAGLMCAGASSNRGRKTLIIEHNKKLGEKIRISGGGRCNFTNIHASPADFISQNRHFCVSALKRFGVADFISMVEKHEISYHEKTLGQLFCDKSSQQIIDMLVDECDEKNIDILLENSVEKVAKIDDGFFLKLANAQELQCESLVIASGGLSIPKMGASDFGYKIAEQFGVKIIAPYAALVPLKIADSELVELAGVSFEARVSCLKKSFREGILITHRGLSGPAILQISSYLDGVDSRCGEIAINALPDFDIYEIFLREKMEAPRQEIAQIIAKYLPKRFANYIAEKNNAFGFIAELSKKDLRKIADFIHNWSLEIAGDEGYAKAEVTCGGIDTNEVSSKNFECKKVKGLYFIGEILDVTGHLGGFNFQFAWSCGFACGEIV